MIGAVVPVKTLAAAKSRLLPHLGAEVARRLSVAMLEDVLAALLAVPALGRVAVVSPDAEVGELARRAGAEALVREDPGLNEAIESACEEVEDQEDKHLYHTQGWSRELWLEALGLPAVVPPPEEEKDVATAIGAARAKQQREEML